MIKSTALLTVALFFTVAPSPDAEIWSEITGGFLQAGNATGIPADELAPAMQNSFAEVKPSLQGSTGF